MGCMAFVCLGHYPETFNSFSDALTLPRKGQIKLGQPAIDFPQQKQHFNVKSLIL